MYNSKFKITAFLLAICILIGGTSFADASKVSMATTTTVPTSIDFTGIILDISNKQVLVQSTLNNQVYDKILFNLSKETKFDGMHLTELNIGDLIVVTHGLAIAKSLPPQTQALVIKSGSSIDKIYNYEGIIKEITKDNDTRLVLVESVNKKDVYKQIRFVVSGSTKLIKTTLDDLVIGERVKLTHGIAMTRSIPPQTQAFSLELLEESYDYSKVEGRITSIIKLDTNQLLIIRTRGSKGGSKEMFFLVTNQTKFGEIDANSLKAKDTVTIKYHDLGSNNSQQVFTALFVEASKGK